MGRFHITFLCVLTHSYDKCFNGLCLLNCFVVSYIFSEPISHILLLSVAQFQLFPHIICTEGFYWSFQCDALNRLSWWPFLVQRKTTLLFHSSNLFRIIIAKINPHNFPQHFSDEVPCIFFSLLFCLSACAFWFYNSPLVTVSSILIVSAAAICLMRFSSELAT